MVKRNPSYSAERQNGITREEFAEMRSNVSNIAHDIDTVSTAYQTERKERDLRLDSAISKLESEMRNRFEKNEELADSKNTISVEGRRWLIGTIAGLVVVMGAVINWWGTSIRESTLAEMNNSLNIIHEQNAVSIKDRDDIRRAMQMLSDNSNANTVNISTMKAKFATQLIEVETQFRASDRARNVQFAEQQRQNINFQNSLSGMQAKVPNAPEAPFYFPEITHDGNSDGGL